MASSSTSALRNRSPRGACGATKYRGTACGRNKYPFGITDHGIQIDMQEAGDVA